MPKPICCCKSRCATFYMLCNILPSRLAKRRVLPSIENNKLLNIIPEKVLTATCYITPHTAKHDMLHNLPPNTICCTICRQTQHATKHTGYYPECYPTQHTVQHAAQITAQHNKLPNLPVNTIFCQTCRPTQHIANCRLTCRSTKYAVLHAAQQNMLSNKTC
jgi:hypothetical protein